MKKTHDQLEADSGAWPTMTAIRASQTISSGDQAIPAGTDGAADDDAVPAGKRAALYLRVSTPRQVNTDYDPEGLSLPAQRLACERKAQQLGYTVVAEYVEPGRSATEMTRRVEFQAMLARIRREKDVDVIIVHKLSRFARNRMDDAIVMADLQKRGVALVSATESIDETPAGQLMHGILAAFNEFRSREDGADISYKMRQKAVQGGTIGLAPLGYLNTIERFEGHEVRSVAVDPVRAPFVKLAFELYADEDYSIDRLVDELTDRGFVTRSTAKRAAGPVSSSKIHTMLRDRYYLGEVSYKGETFAGRHEPLIDEALFNRVQELLDERGRAGERKRRHSHYLKGTVWCGRCYLQDQAVRRLILMRAVGRQGNEYWYFFCRGVQDHICDAPYSNVDRVEAAVEEHYKTLQLSPDFIAAVRAAMEAALADLDAARRTLHAQLTKQLGVLDQKENKLLDLASDDSLPQTKIRERLREIARDRDRLTAELNSAQVDLAVGQAFIDSQLQLLENPYELYLKATDEVRRKLNQAIFKRIYVVNDEVVADELTTPLAALLAAQHGVRALQAGQATEVAMGVAERELERRSPKRKQDIPERDALLEGLLAAAHTVSDCSKPPVVPLEGVEPPTLSLGRNCSSIELQRRGTGSVGRRPARRCRHRPRRSGFAVAAADPATCASGSVPDRDQPVCGHRAAVPARHAGARRRGGAPPRRGYWPDLQ